MNWKPEQQVIPRLIVFLRKITGNIEYRLAAPPVLCERCGARPSVTE